MQNSRPGGMLQTHLHTVDCWSTEIDARNRVLVKSMDSVEQPSNGQFRNPFPERVTRCRGKLLLRKRSCQSNSRHWSVIKLVNSTGRNQIMARLKEKYTCKYVSVMTFFFSFHFISLPRYLFSIQRHSIRPELVAYRCGCHTVMESTRYTLLDNINRINENENKR